MFSDDKFDRFFYVWAILWSSIAIGMLIFFVWVTVVLLKHFHYI